MTQELQQKTIIDPGLSDVLALHKMATFASMNCVKIGKITSFDATKKTAQVQVLFKRQLPDGTIVSYTPLIDCPVFTLQGGGGYLQMPIAAGDNCILLFSDRSIDEWYQNGQEALPANTRMHDASDAIAIVGLNPLSSSGPVAPTNKIVMSYLGSRFELTATGWNFVGEGTGEIDINGAIITIKNTTTSLLILLDGLIDVIAALQVNGPIPLTAASIAALQAYKLQLATLLG